MAVFSLHFVILTIARSIMIEEGWLVRTEFMENYDRINYLDISE
jgi:hypothetical protein